MSKKVFNIFLLIGLLLGCSKVDESENAARLRIKLTDSPMLMLNDTSLAIREINVQIQSIEVAVTDSTDNEIGEWKKLDFEGGVYNMKTLTNGKNVQLVDQYFPANKTIRRIRILLGTNNKIVAAASQGEKELIIPQEYKDGIVFDVIENLYANLISSLVIDMRAFVTEANGNYFLDPNVRIFSEVSTGSIKGYYAPLESQAIVSVLNTPDTFFTIPEPDGMFLFPGLREGKWQIGIFPNPRSGFKDTIFVDSVFTNKATVLKQNPIRLHEKIQ